MYYKFAAAFVLLSLARPIRAPPANSTTTESTLSVSAGFRGGQIELENTEFLLHPPAATTLTAAILSTTTTTTLSHKTPPYTNFPLPLHHSKHDQYQQPRRPPKPHLFWGEQPVVENNEMEEYSLGQPDLPFLVSSEGTIEPDIRVDQRQSVLPLDYEWSVLDLDTQEDILQLYTLLRHNYVEDATGQYRLAYSPSFLKWALKPPGWLKDWHLGIRHRATGLLVGFISAIPVQLQLASSRPGSSSSSSPSDPPTTTRSSATLMAQVNFLCVQKRLRSKRMSAILIKEIRRRIKWNKAYGHIQHSIYTGASRIPAGFIGEYSYYHYSLKTLASSITRPELDLKSSSSSSSLSSPSLDAISSPLGLRSVRERDIPSLTVLLNRHLSSSSSHSSFEISPVFTEEQVRHQFLPRENVIYSLVGENEDGELIEFVSFYSLNSMVIAPPTVWPGHDIRNLLSTSGVSSSSTVNTGVDDDELAKLDKECNDPSNTIKTAHLYYYVPPLSTRRSAGSIKSSSAPREESLLDEMITKTIHVARQLGYHQLTCLDVMGNSRFLDRLGFVKNAKNAGLNYFLYNYRFRNVQADKMAFLIV